MNKGMNTYTLVADAGSTKSTWCLATLQGKTQLFQTAGINPVTQDETTISDIITKELVPQLAEHINIEDIRLNIHYYGAGCIPTLCEKMQVLLTSIFPNSTATVGSDLLGAARAVCGHEPGIVCILGTGANSCYYDGMDITLHTSPLGYILGDEGSGAYLGKRLVSDLFKGLLSEEIYQEFIKKYDLTEAELIRKVYREPGANFYLASFTPFLAEHRRHNEIHQLIISCFNDFFNRNINGYGAQSRTVNFVGSIALHFRDELAEVAKAHDYAIGRIVQSPIELMTRYHTEPFVTPE